MQVKLQDYINIIDLEITYKKNMYRSTRIYKNNKTQDEIDREIEEHFDNIISNENDIKMKKALIKACAEINPKYSEVYKELFPHGGKRPGLGRPRGSKTDKTERINIAVTPQEKEFIMQQLKAYREKQK